MGSLGRGVLRLSLRISFGAEKFHVFPTWVFGAGTALLPGRHEARPQWNGQTVRMPMLPHL